MIVARAPYSWLDDPSVPEFDAGKVFTVMDARCSLCACGASWIARHDKAEEFTIIPLQSETGNALMRHYGLDPADPASWLYVEEGRTSTSLEALVRVGKRLGGRWKGIAVFSILPTALQDKLYRGIARNRYRLFGKADLCSLRDAEVQKRLLK